MAQKQQFTAQKRAKIRLNFPEKMFYEKTLAEWKDNITDANHASVIRRALTNLQKFPLNVKGISELRKIRGIGEEIAKRLDASWKFACETQFNSQTPNVEQIKALSRGEPFRLLECSSGSVGGRKNGIPFVAKNRLSANSIQQQKGEMAVTLTKGLSSGSPSHMLSTSPQPRVNNLSPSKPSTSCSHAIQPTQSTAIICPENEEASCSSSISTSSLALTARFPAKILRPNENVDSEENLESDEPPQKRQKMLSYTPGETIGECRLLLITDNRESVGGITKKRCVKGVVEHLTTMGVQCESRSLSVGDYLWLLQWVDWEGQQQELVMEYIVERKTWDDLKKSIRETRYAEQKGRLRKCGIKNVCLVVEGGQNADRSLEQAMVSTNVEDGFLVHRTQNAQGTAKFLHHLTKRLEQKWKDGNEKIVGLAFKSLQENCKKATPRMVADCWLRQLTVCPGMSVEKAQLIRQRFPTFRAFVEFYRKGDPMDGQMLVSECSLLTLATSKQLLAFLQRAHSIE